MGKVWTWLDRRAWSLPPALAAACFICLFMVSILHPSVGPGEILVGTGIFFSFILPPELLRHAGF